MVQPFYEVVKSLTRYDVIPLGDAKVEVNEFKAVLQRIAEKSAYAMKQDPIERPRPNEVGNDAEKFVIDSLEEEPGISVVPMRYKTGYPDIKICLRSTKEVVFLECKTFGLGKANDSMRSFYLSPGKAVTAKIDCNAPHIMMSFEMRQEGNIFTPVTYKLVDLYDLPCNLKEEWQSNNQDLYAEQRVLVSEIC